VEQARNFNLRDESPLPLVDGNAGIAQVQIGNWWAHSVLTSVSQVDPIKAYFQSANMSMFSHREAEPLPANTQIGFFFGNSLELILT